MVNCTCSWVKEEGQPPPSYQNLSPYLPNKNFTPCCFVILILSGFKTILISLTSRTKNQPEVVELLSNDAGKSRPHLKIVIFMAALNWSGCEDCQSMLWLRWMAFYESNNDHGSRQRPLADAGRPEVHVLGTRVQLWVALHRVVCHHLEQKFHSKQPTYQQSTLHTRNWL